ncbi:MAG: phosphoenolpyruvate--protein phosphotransferase [Oligoflexales bacterium]|nr:phosphoenolpyruvate--protein phosphotransferase [Oligoflexales bacterium]
MSVLSSSQKSVLTLKAPLSGQIYPLEKVPDPVFSKKMVGDGISIDPTSSTLVSPCEGTISYIHPSKHALTITTYDGLEIMMHIGLDTVALKGKGFSPRVKISDPVKTGDLLIDFDADLIAQNSKSLLTQIVITNGEDVSVSFTEDFVAAAKDTAFTIEKCGTALEEHEQADLLEESKTCEKVVVVKNPSGIHARPAATIVTAAKGFPCKVDIIKGDLRGNGKSIIGLLELELREGDECIVKAYGPKAEACLETVSSLLADILEEEEDAPVGEPSLVQEDLSKKPFDANKIYGAGVSSGIVFGQVFQTKEDEIEVPQAGKGVREERDSLLSALSQAKVELKQLRKDLVQKNDERRAAIFTAHLEILEDPDILEGVEKLIQDGNSAAFAWQQTYQAIAKKMMGLKNELFAARANDLRDVGKRVLNQLMGCAKRSWKIPYETIIVAEDLTPSDVVDLDKDRVVGFCTVAGGPTSHVAILAKSLGIPAIAGIDSRVLDVENGVSAILDGDKGLIQLNPEEDDIVRVRKELEEKKAIQEKNLALAHEPACTTDGTSFEIFANIGSYKDAKQGVKLGAEGVGLLRSEFLFLQREKAPTMKEQRDIYISILQALGNNKTLIVRTLDVGGDKPLAYLPFPKEENPFLGIRGARVGLLKHPEILRQQLQAILEASAHGPIAVMLPMIAMVEEIRELKQMLEEERQKLGCKPIPFGMMIEVPSAALLAHSFAKEVDFFSIGTNDLAQYVLAMDRTHQELSKKIDGLHPAVLRLINETTRAGKKNKVHVGVCGGIASDLDAVLILAGLEIDEFSVSTPMIPQVKAEIRKYSLEECKQLAQESLELESAEEVRKLVRQFKESKKG